MISLSCDIEEFIESVKGKGYWEAMSLAEREAVEAWRFAHRKKDLSQHRASQLGAYEESLKNLVCRMRSALPPCNAGGDHTRLFESLRRDLLSKEA
jgi:hypothetical protein